MKKLVLLVLVSVIICVFNLYDSKAQNVGINTDTPDESALLELKSSNQGFLPPRLSTEERDAIVSPAEGLIIYNTTEKCINYFEGMIWLSICGSTSSSSVDIEVHPGNADVCEGEVAIFSVNSPDAAIFQWQVNTGNGWQNIDSQGTSPSYSGYNSSELTVSDVTIENNFWTFRCIVTGSNPPPSISDEAVLSIIPLPDQPSEIIGPTEICPSSETIFDTETFDTNILVHGTSGIPTNVWFAPSYNTPIAHSSTGGCPGGQVGYEGSWNNFWGNFLRTPEIDCTGHDEVIMTFDVSHSHFSNHPNDWCRFYVWADGGYLHNVQSVKINGVDVTYDSGINGKGFSFTEVRSCDAVEVTFDISEIGNKSNILFYIEPSCGYNNSNLFYVWFDNIGFNGAGGGSEEYNYSVEDAGYSYQWIVPTGWMINSGQGTNSISVTPNDIDGDISVIPSNSCGAGPSQTINVEVCP